MNLYPNNEQRGDQHIDTQPDHPYPVAKVKTEKMTDGSIAHNVVMTIDGISYRSILLACETSGHAAQLATLLNMCSWVEVIENGKV